MFRFRGYTNTILNLLDHVEGLTATVDSIAVQCGMFNIMGEV